MKKEKEIVEKWLASGLLENLNDSHKAIVALKLEAVESILNGRTDFPSKINILSFPITRRIAQNEHVLQNLDTDHMFKMLLEKYQKEGWIVETLQNTPNHTLDAEAEFCAFFSQEYIDNYHDPKKKALFEEKNRWAIIAGIIKS